MCVCVCVTHTLSLSLSLTLLLPLPPPPFSGPRYNNYWHTAAAMGLRYHFVTASEGFALWPRHAAEIALFLLT